LLRLPSSSDLLIEAYTSATEAAVPIVSWPSSSQVNAEVFEWYQNLQACYTQVLADVTETNSDANGFFNEINRCYGRVAYIYRSPTSVYNVSIPSYCLQTADSRLMDGLQVTLMNNNDTLSDSTPILSRYIYSLPDVDLDGGIDLNAVDYIVAAVILLVITLGIYFFIKKFIVKVWLSSRHLTRHVSHDCSVRKLVVESRLLENKWQHKQ
jgi:hypothetical protein